MLKFSLLFILLVTNFFVFSSEEVADQIDANTLQGLTKEAFVTTNDFDNLKLTIERIKSNAESCADSIVDLQLGLSSLSDDERFVREKDLQRIINDYSNISSELISISSVEGQGDRAQTLYALQSDLEAIESEINALQTYVQTYLGHLTTGDKKWYFLNSGFLAGTNNSFTANAAISQYILLVGQTFRTKTDSVITKIKIRLPNGIYPLSDRVFISPYNSTLSTNTFINAISVDTNEAPVYTYNFPNYHTYALAPYVFGLRGIGTSPIGAYCCTNEYVDDFGYLCIGNFTRANPTQYAMSLQTQYDLCFDMVFQSDTNMIVSADGIELNNGANIRISGNRVTTISELNTTIAQATQSLSYAISNHVFGTSSIANNAITTDKIASNAITSDKIVSNSVTTVKIEDSAITSDKIANNAVITDKIANSAVTREKLATGAVTHDKILYGTITADQIANNSITAQKLVNNTITSNQLAIGSVTEEKIAANSITGNKILNNSITGDKIQNDSIAGVKITNNSLHGNKIVNGTITSDKLSDGVVSSNKIASAAIIKNHLSDDLINNLITSDGGTINGLLEVDHMRFNCESDWLIGQTNICSDIVMLNEDAKIRSNAGQLKLAAGQGKNISAESFFSFDSGSQAGIAMIANGSKGTDVPCDGITSEAIIMLTPRQIVSNLWWSVQSIPSNSKFRITINRDPQVDLFFNYLIIRK